MCGLTTGGDLQGDETFALPGLGVLLIVGEDADRSTSVARNHHEPRPAHQEPATPYVPVVEFLAPSHTVSKLGSVGQTPFHNCLQTPLHNCLSTARSTLSQFGDVLTTAKCVDVHHQNTDLSCVHRFVDGAPTRLGKV
jgi:hypothetical protein